MAMPHIARRQRGDVKSEPPHMRLSLHRHYEDLKNTMPDVRDDVIKEVAILTEGFSKYFPSLVQFWNAVIDYSYGLQAEKMRDESHAYGDQHMAFAHHTEMINHYSNAASAILHGVAPNDRRSEVRQRITTWAVLITGKVLESEDPNPKTALRPVRRD